MVSKKNAKGEDTEDEQTKLFGFRTAYIFDVADTEGGELAQFATVSDDPQHYTERLKVFIAAQGITLEFDNSIAPARGLSKGGAIVLLPDLSPAETTSVLAHEVAHLCCEYRYWPVCDTTLKLVPLSDGQEATAWGFFGCPFMLVHFAVGTR